MLWAPFYDNSFVKQTGKRNPNHTFTFDGELPLQSNKNYWVGDIAGNKIDIIPGKQLFCIYMILI